VHGTDSVPIMPERRISDWRCHTRNVWLQLCRRLGWRDLSVQQQRLGALLHQHVGYLVVAGPGTKTNELAQQPCCLKVIDSRKIGLSTLKCGGFESQILSTDSLAKLDGVVEGVLRRIERAVQEADKDGTNDKIVSGRDAEGDTVPLSFDGEERQFMVKGSNGKFCSTADYLRSFEWQRFGMVSMQDTAREIQISAEAIDAKFRTEAQKYTEQKNEWFLVQPPDDTGAAFSFATKDLVDVFMPGNVTEFYKDQPTPKPHQDDDFIYTKNITTVVVVVPSGADAAFVAWHDGCVEQEKVIPGSAKELKKAGKDKDGASLYRVLVMKSGQTAFLKACREANWVTSDFVYKGQSGYAKLQQNRKDFEEAFKASQLQLLKNGLNYWSDVFQCWTHLKVLRAAVEGNLRYGEIPAFALVCLPSDPAPCRRQLASILGTEKERLMEDADVDDYFPYVSVALQAS